jgi:transcriptional regulator with XRE-family HTH domain
MATKRTTPAPPAAKDPFVMDVGVRLKAARIKSNLTQPQVALQLRLNGGKQVVWAWENGGNDPGVKQLCQLAKLYGVTTDELLTGVPSMLSPEARMLGHLLDKVPEDRRVEASHRAQQLIEHEFLETTSPQAPSKSLPEARPTHARDVRQ